MTPNNLATTCDIYEIKNTKWDRVYVGASHNGFARCRSHLWLLTKGKHQNDAMQQDWALSTIADWQFRLLERGLPEGIAGERERYWINAREAMDPIRGYNRRDPPILRQTATDERVRSVLQMISQGMPYRQIAKAHGISHGSVGNIYAKYGGRYSR